MSKDRRALLWDLFDQAADLPPEKQQTLLDAACGDDADLRAEVEQLLAGDARLHANGSAMAFLDSPVARSPQMEKATAPVASATAALPLRIGPYRILRLLGEGGMGVVYEAEQENPRRPVALKVIRPGLVSPELLKRFAQEAQILGRLHHPGIAQIYDAGVAEDGQPFFALEFIRGLSLDEYARRNALDPAASLELLARVCDAVQHAHDQGIIHRDLKPGNILVDETGQPKVLDFGVARVTDADLRTTTDRTRTGQLLGTLNYMSPEQVVADPAGLDQRSDVYTLGVMLFELLAGRLPYPLEQLPLPEAARVIREQEPSRLGLLDTHLRGDVETIVALALEKDRERRYPSAAELAADIRRHLRNEPIMARAPSALYQLRKFTRRNKVLVLGVIGVILSLVAGLIGTTLFAMREARQRYEAEHHADRAEKEKTLANEARRAEAESRRAEAEARREAENTLVDMYTTSGIQAGDQGENGRAALWFANAARLVEPPGSRAAPRPRRQQANVIRARTWGRRALAPLHAFVADGSWPGGLVFHPEGRHLLVTTVLDGSTRESSYTLWDVDAEQSLSFPGGAKTVPAAAWSPDGLALAVGRSDGNVIVASFPGGAEAARIGFPGRIRLLTYSADGRYLAIAGGNSARVWDVRAGVFATPELAHPEAVTTMGFHPEGRYLTTACRDNLARLFAVPGNAGKPLWSPVPHHQVSSSDPRFPPVFFSPPQFIDRGRGLLIYGGKGSLSWRSVETGAEVRTLDCTDKFVRGVGATKLSPDGRYLAVLSFGHYVIQLFEAATGRPVGPVLEHKNTVYDAAFSPDSQTLLTSSSDGTARLWAVPGGEPMVRPLDLHRTVHRVAFAPNGRSLATQDGELVRLWALPQEGLPAFGVPLDPSCSFAALSPDGALVIPTGFSCGTGRALRTTRAYGVATSEPAGPPLRPGGLIVDAAFSPDGRSVATVDARDDTAKEGQEVRVWDWKGGQMRWRKALPSEPRSVSYHPDGGRLAVLCGGGELIVFDAGAGREVRRWKAHEAENAGHWVTNGKVRFSPDGRILLTWGMGNDARVWEAETGELRYPPLPHRDKCHDLQFSPDGRSMALASYDGSVRVRDLATGTVLGELPAHPDLVYSASFSPDGRLLVTACRDHAVRVWNWQEVRLVCQPFEHEKDAIAASFTPDGRWVLSVSSGTARVWDWRTGKPVTPLLAAGGIATTVVVTPDCRHAVVGGFLTELRVLDLSELGRADDDLDALCLWAELLAGQRLHEGGGTVNLSAAEWLQRWRDFRRLGEGRK